MPTTKRLMTDETGQDIASAIEDLAIAVKPDATEIPMASDSNATVAESITNLQDGMAIIADGNTHASATSGQFIFVKNHDISAGFTGNAALATGLYTASAAIGTNADLTTANLTADPSGGFNALQGQIDTLNSNLSAKATVAKTGWGTQVDVPSNHAIIMLNGNVRIQVWLSGNNGVSLWFNRQPTTGQHIEYYKEDQSNTVTFGPTGADGTGFTITRSGSTFSFTANQSYSIKVLY